MRAMEQRGLANAWVLFARSGLLATLLLAAGCSDEADHCAAFSESCNKWCEGMELTACLNEGAALDQAGDQAACFDATMRLACDDFAEAEDAS